MATLIYQYANDKRINAYNVEQRLRKSGRGLHEEFPDGYILDKFLNSKCTRKERLSFYNITSKYRNNKTI